MDRSNPHVPKTHLMTSTSTQVTLGTNGSQGNISVKNIIEFPSNPILCDKGEIEIYIQSDHSDENDITNGEDDPGDKEKVQPSKMMTNSGISEFRRHAIITKRATASDLLSEIHLTVNKVSRSVQVSTNLLL